VDNLIQDLKHGLQLLRRRPGFSAVAIASLALGVGLNTTLFSVVNAVLLRNTPVQEPQRLVEIYSSLSGCGSDASAAGARSSARRSS
jgi:putative ABC transport system permease protein